MPYTQIQSIVTQVLSAIFILQHCMSEVVAQRIQKRIMCFFLCQKGLLHFGLCNRVVIGAEPHLDTFKIQDNNGHLWHRCVHCLSHLFKI